MLRNSYRYRDELMVDNMSNEADIELEWTKCHIFWQQYFQYLQIGIAFCRYNSDWNITEFDRNISIFFCIAGLKLFPIISF